jgi:hypothetical protein
MSPKCGGLMREPRVDYGLRSEQRERLSRNLAEVIDDLYREHAPPRDHERMLDLVQHQIRHAILLEKRSWQKMLAAT